MIFIRVNKLTKIQSGFFVLIKLIRMIIPAEIKMKINSLGMDLAID